MKRRKAHEAKLHKAPAGEPDLRRKVELLIFRKVRVDPVAKDKVGGKLEKPVLLPWHRADKGFVPVRVVHRGCEDSCLLGLPARVHLLLLAAKVCDLLGCCGKEDPGGFQVRLQVLPRGAPERFENPVSLGQNRLQAICLLLRQRILLLRIRKLHPKKPRDARRLEKEPSRLGAGEGEIPLLVVSAAAKVSRVLVTGLTEDVRPELFDEAAEAVRPVIEGAESLLCQWEEPVPVLLPDEATDLLAQGPRHHLVAVVGLIVEIQLPVPAAGVGTVPRDTLKFAIIRRKFQNHNRLLN